MIEVLETIRPARLREAVNRIALWRIGKLVTDLPLDYSHTDESGALYLAQGIEGRMISLSRAATADRHATDLRLEVYGDGYGGIANIRAERIQYMRDPAWEPDQRRYNLRGPERSLALSVVAADLLVARQVVAAHSPLA